VNFRARLKPDPVGFQMTPMIDVVFLLLCFFVTSQVFSQWEAEVDITLPDGSMLEAGRSRDQSDSEQWGEIFVGGRVGVDLSEGWTMEIRSDIGGFGVNGSEFSWQAAGVIGYRWRFKTWAFSAFGGYRALGQDYTNGDFGWDMVVYGPILGVGFSF